MRSLGAGAMLGVIVCVGCAGCSYDRARISATEPSGSSPFRGAGGGQDGSALDSSAGPQLQPATIPMRQRPAPDGMADAGADGQHAQPGKVPTGVPDASVAIDAMAMPMGLPPGPGPCTEADEPGCTEPPAVDCRLLACDARKTCIISGTGAACGACPDGFGDVGGACVDTDECSAPSACGANRDCQNLEGTFTCGECLDGFHEVDDLCTDIDECETENFCDPQAFCMNTTGAYECRCPAYYTSLDAGRTCSDTRLGWLFTAPLYGLQSIPFESDLLLIGTLDRRVVIDGTEIEPVGPNDRKDMFVARLDAQRKLVWHKRFGGVYDDRVMWADLDSRGNVLFTGFTDGGLDLGVGAIETGGKRVRFLAKLGIEDGSHVWSHTLANADSTNENDAWEGFVSATDDDSVLFCGRFKGNSKLGTFPLEGASPDTWDAFIAKLTADGAVMWAKRWGSAGNEQCRAVIADGDGNLMAAGQFDARIDFGDYRLDSLGFTDVFLTKLDASGGVIWSHGMGGSSYDEIGRLAVDSAGDAIVGGAFMHVASFGGAAMEAVGDDWDAWMAKWTSAGEPLWTRRMGGEGTDVIWGIVSGPNDEFAVAGMFSQSIDMGEGVRLGAGRADAFIARYARDGTLRWSRTFGGPQWDTAAGLRFDGAGRLFANGWFEAPLDLGKGTAEVSGMYLMEIAP